MTDPFPDPFPPQEETAPVVEPAPVPAATYVTDRVLVQIVVARMQDGRKVGEFPCQAVPLLYPFDSLPQLCEIVAGQVAAQQAANG